MAVVDAKDSSGVQRSGEQEGARREAIPVAISARHVHLTQATVERLFGSGHALHLHSELSQPGQLAAEETVTLVGPHDRLEHVRVVGPLRRADQVEISRSDEVLLGIDAPVRLSGELGGPRGPCSKAPKAGSPCPREWCVP